MAQTRNMAYDHPAYLVPMHMGGANAAGANAVSSRFAAVTDMIAKSFSATVITAGTNTNATLALVKVLGTSTSTLGSVTLSTSVAGVSTNVLCTASSISEGDVVWVQGGSDATGVFAVGLELYITPGASLTP
jgi:thiamine monophosphate kinase